jgi:hypothetical protein
MSAAPTTAVIVAQLRPAITQPPSSQLLSYLKQQLLPMDQASYLE